MVGKNYLSDSHIFLSVHTVGLVHPETVKFKYFSRTLKATHKGKPRKWRLANSMSNPLSETWVVYGYKIKTLCKLQSCQLLAVRAQKNSQVLLSKSKLAIATGLATQIFEWNIYSSL